VLLLRDDAGGHGALLKQQASTLRRVSEPSSLTSTFGLPENLYWNNKLIATAGESRNVVASSGGLIESFSQYRDALGEIVLVHEGIWPDVLQQFILGDDPSGVLDEVKQHVKCATLQGHGAVIAPQRAFQGFNPELTELEYLTHLFEFIAIHNLSVAVRMGHWRSCSAMRTIRAR
jgi:hypothetical protein